MTVKNLGGRPKNKKGTPMRCPKCGNEWLTNGRGRFVTCSLCHKQLPNPNRKAILNE